MRLASLVLTAGLLFLAGCGDNAGTPQYDLTPESNQKFLADNAKLKGVTTLPDGLQYRVINAGHGKAVAHPTDIVTVTYKGWTIDKHVFDRTEHGETRDFPVGQLIPGWTEALMKMHVGDEWQIVIPADLGYGAEGAGADIGPNQTLVFNMQLINVRPADNQTGP
ncbi:MAG TPA: FKBP-type peptidyl-prolyl cis-trans isomerase [Rhizomicrobium sp.]|nr:FKBP-type peptidyl-prolyl cis-trans isomerase [Rhizomicrobium sp.]